MDDGAWCAISGCAHAEVDRVRFCAGAVHTSLELNGDRLVRAFHEKPTMPVSQALSVAALDMWFSNAVGLLGCEGRLT